MTQLDEHFVAAVEWLLACEEGRWTGMGKSGHIGRKLSATLFSTGTSLFLHPGEGVHGDLGVVARQDVVILLSNSGTTEECFSYFLAINWLSNSFNHS